MYTGLLIKVEFDFVSKHLPDDSDKLADTVSEGIVVRPTFRYLGAIVSFECEVILYNIVDGVHECTSEHFGVTFEHSGTFAVVTGLVSRRA